MSRPPAPPVSPTPNPDKLTSAQRRALNNDDIDWVGWDIKGRPVFDGLYHNGLLQRRGVPHRDAVQHRWSLLRTGERVAVAEPIRYFEPKTSNE